jgi:hypothetical protein
LLPEIAAISLPAVMSGAKGWPDIEQFGTS